MEAETSGGGAPSEAGNVTAPPAGDGDAAAPSSGGGLSGQALEAITDPNVVDKLIDELKSQGMFDQIRKDCLAEVDTKVNSNFSHNKYTQVPLHAVRTAVVWRLRDGTSGGLVSGLLHIRN